jgi:hypothetical protein
LWVMDVMDSAFANNVENEGVSVPIWVLLAVLLLLTGSQWVRKL